VDAVAPLGGPTRSDLPRPLRDLAAQPDRDLAALAADNWFRIVERDRTRQRPATARQCGLKFPDGKP
jgi:hypothetical protein